MLRILNSDTDNLTFDFDYCMLLLCIICGIFLSTGSSKIICTRIEYDDIVLFDIGVVIKEG